MFSNIFLEYGLVAMEVAQSYDKLLASWKKKPIRNVLDIRIRSLQEYRRWHQKKDQLPPKTVLPMSEQFHVFDGKGQFQENGWKILIPYSYIVWRDHLDAIVRHSICTNKREWLVEFGNDPPKLMEVRLSPCEKEHNTLKGFDPEER